MNILVTGGTGFIGTHLVRHLRRFHNVFTYDLKQGQDIRSEGIIGALDGMDVVYHLAAYVGTAQSQYEIGHCVDVNTRGTANLLEAIVKHHRVKRLILAASMSSYMEGGLEAGVTEFHPQLPGTIYGYSKKHQEDLCRTVGHVYNIPVVALRFFNVYGSGQSLDNPYSGVAAIFLNRLLNDLPPVIFGDGSQSRDFVHVSDVVHACDLALDIPSGAYNVGTGYPTSICSIARLLAHHMGKAIEPQMEKARKGDIKHIYADISKLSSHGYKPLVDIEQGLKDLVNETHGPEKDAFGHVLQELDQYGLYKDAS